MLKAVTVDNKKLLVSAEHRLAILEDERRKRWQALVDNDVMTVLDAATFLQMHWRTVYVNARAHLIPAVKVGSMWRFSRKNLTDFIQGRINADGTVRDGKELKTSRLSERSVRNRLKGGDKQEVSISDPSLKDAGGVEWCPEEEPTPEQSEIASF